MKSVKVLYPNGETKTLDPAPDFYTMRDIIAEGRPHTLLERVVVLDSILKASGGAAPVFVYTLMFLDEEGLLKNLPRNDLATEAYQRNIRAQFPKSSTPFADAKALAIEAAKRQGFTYIDIGENAPGFDPNDPHVVGIAILFDGWMMDEVEEHLEKEDDEDVEPTQRRQREEEND